MARCNDIIQFMEELAPPSLAEEWDNVGLLLGSREKSVRRILLCMDITSASVKRAITEEADIIITHHPIIFKGIKSITGEDAKGRLLYELIRRDISVYAAHTNLDFAEQGVNSQLAQSLGLQNPEMFGKGPGKVGFLKQGRSMAEYIDFVKKMLNVPHIRVIGGTDGKIMRVAVFCGSFDDDLEAVLQSGADILVTGDLKYHAALEAAEAGIPVIDAGHFHTEKIVLPWLADALGRKFPDLSVIRFEEEEDPFKTY